MDSGTGTTVPHILILEDDADHQDLVLRAFRKDPDQLRVSVAGTIHDARDIIGRDPPDLIIADWMLPDGKGIEILPRRDGVVTVPLVIMTSYGDEALAVEIMKSGAIDYVVKSATVFRDLPHIARRALRDWENIRQRNQAEEAARDSQKVLADILSFLPDAVLAIDNEGRVIAWNKAIEEMTGVVAVDMLGKGDHEYSIPFYDERRPILIDLILKGDTEIGKKYLFVHHDGERLVSEVFIPEMYGGRGAHLWFIASPLYDTAGKRVGAIETIRDITERKKVEKEIRDSRNFLNSIIEQSPHPMWISDEKGTLVQLNKACCEMLQITPEEVVGKYNVFEDTIVEGQGMMPLVRSVFEEGRTVTFDLHYDTSQLKTLVLERFTCVILQVTIFPVRDGTGKITNAVIQHVNITERKQAEKTLQESEERYRNVVEDQTEFICRFTPDGRITFVNDAYCRYFSLDKSQCIAKSHRVMLMPEDARLMKRHIASLTQENPVATIEHRIIMPSGEIRWQRWSDRAIFNKEGLLVEYQSVGRDITEKKQVEEALHRSEQFLQQTQHLTKIGGWEFDVVAGKIRWTDEVYRIYGVSQDYDPNDVSQNIQFYASEDQTAIESAFRRAVEDGEPYDLDLRLVSGDGTKKWVRTTAQIDRVDGRTVRVYGNIIDITDRKEAEKALSDSERKFRTIADFTYDWEYWTRPDGNLIYTAPSCERISGYTQEEFYRDKTLMVRIIHPDDTGRIEKHLDTIKNTSEAESVELRIITKDGSTLWIEHVCQPIFGPDGEDLGRRGSNRDITKRKEAETALRESETRFRALIQNSSDIIRILDRDGRIVYESASAERILGYPPGYLIGKDPSENTHPEDLGKVKTDLREVYDRTNIGIPTEFRIRKADGEYIWVDSLGTNLLDVPGVNGIVLTIRPIQQRKQAEQALQVSEERYRSIVEDQTEFICRFAADGRLTFVNDAYCRYFNLDKSQCIAKPHVVMLYPEDARLIKRHLASLTIKNPVAIIEHRIIMPSGKIRWQRWSDRAIFDKDGRLIEYQSVGRDTTEKKQAEEALRESEMRYRSVIENAAEGIVVVQDGILQYANTRALEMVDLSPEEIGNQQFTGFIHPEDRALVFDRYQRRIRGESVPQNYDFRIVGKSGQIIWVQVSAVQISWNDRPATLNFLTDITTHKFMESEIRSLNTVLEQRIKDRTEALLKANEALETENAQRQEAEKKLQGSYDEKVMLLKEIHHRVKNNLQIIVSLLNLQSRNIKDESTRAAIRDSQNRVKAMALVHEKLYRAEDISHISLQDYIRFLGSGLFQFYDAKSRGIRFTLEIHEVYVDIDSAIPLGLILNELISNSLKYAFPEGRKGEIAISVKREDRTMTVMFRDTGIGIPADLDWRNTRSLGLRLVNTLVDQMNGTVELDRSAGTLFTLIVHEKEQRVNK